MMIISAKAAHTYEYLNFEKKHEFYKVSNTFFELE
jgi:hypothetical protein